MSAEDMVARVAAAILGGKEIPGLEAEVNKWALEAARRAIEAMKDPTPDMRQAGAIQMNRHKILKTRFRAGAPDIWMAMVLAALDSEGSRS